MHRVILASLIAVLGLAVSAAADRGPGRFDRLYVFGDSYSDSGAGYVDGNGPTAVVYMARHLGIAFTWAGAPDAAGKGLNFAVSAAQTGRNAGRRICQHRPPCGPEGVLLGLGMRDQVDAFLALTREGRTRWTPSRTLFFIAGGLNDGGLDTATTVQNLSSEIRDLHAAGGRNFALALLPTRIPAFTAVATRLNPAIRTMAHDLAAEFPDSRFVVTDWGGAFDRIMASPARHGIRDTTTGCAKRAIFGEDPTPCKDPAAHFFYHEAHPSTRVHAIVGERLSAEVRHAFRPAAAPERRR